MIKIIQKGNNILSSVAHKVSLKEIATPKFKKVIRDMKAVIAQEDDAVAVAAPQINVPLRTFIISKDVFNEPDDLESEALQSKKPPSHGVVFINPKIIKRSKKKQSIDEGCLSVRWWYGKVKRYQNVTVEAYDEKGKLFTRGAGGLLAQIFQHEIDHLDGILFDEKATGLHEVIPENNES